MLKWFEKRVDAYPLKVFTNHYQEGFPFIWQATKGLRPYIFISPCNCGRRKL